MLNLHETVYQLRTANIPVVSVEPAPRPTIDDQIKLEHGIYVQLLNEDVYGIDCYHIADQKGSVGEARTLAGMLMIVRSALLNYGVYA